MAKMKIAREDRPQVKVECLRMLATLQLDPARTEFISKFVDTYLRLEADEEQRFQAEVGTLESGEREAIMQTLTSWEEKGLARGRQEGRQEGKQEGKAELVLHLLHRKVGQIPSAIENQIFALETDQLEALAESLLDFEGMDNLNSWLQNLEAS